MEDLRFSTHTKLIFSMKFTTTSGYIITPYTTIRSGAMALVVVGIIVAVWCDGGDRRCSRVVIIIC